MAHAEFSERHYELAINLELIRDTHEYFVPSQNEEAGLGFDIALVPALPRLWSSLTRGLPGVGGGAEARIPRATSLFLQYKRPEFLSNRNGKEAEDREAEFAAPVPYYRFKLGKAQLEVLLDLQATYAGRATVCYAAGKFHNRGDFYAHKLASTVTQNSTFLRLEDVRRQLTAAGAPVTPRGDHSWTYDVHGGSGLLCSDPRRVDGFRLRELRDSLREWTTNAEPIEEHVAALTSELQAWRARTVEPVRDRLPKRPESVWAELEYKAVEIEQLSATAQVHHTLDTLGIGWFLAVPARRRDRHA